MQLKPAVTIVFVCLLENCDFKVKSHGKGYQIIFDVLAQEMNGWELKFWEKLAGLTWYLGYWFCFLETNIFTILKLHVHVVQLFFGI